VRDKVEREREGGNKREQYRQNMRVRQRDREGAYLRGIKQRDGGRERVNRQGACSTTHTKPAFNLRLPRDPLRFWHVQMIFLRPKHFIQEGFYIQKKY